MALRTADRLEGGCQIRSGRRKQLGIGRCMLWERAAVLFFLSEAYHASQTKI